MANTNETINIKQAGNFLTGLKTEYSNIANISHRKFWLNDGDDLSFLLDRKRKDFNLAIEKNWLKFIADKEILIPEIISNV